MTVNKFIEKYNIDMTVKRVDKRPDDLMDGDKMRHFECVLYARTMHYRIYFSQGSAHTKNPTCADILDTLAVDAQGSESNSSFEDFCSEFGYSTDSRRAEKIYKACGEVLKELERLLGHDAVQELMYEIDRL